MELHEYTNAREYEKDMLRFYKGDTFFKNNKKGIFHIVCNPRSAFFHNTVQRMIGVSDGSEVLCQCVLIKHKAHDAVSVSFFEAKQGVDAAVDKMMGIAIDFAVAHKAKRLEISLDGHCDYGIGFSCGTLDVPPLFGESYNPAFYHDYFNNGYAKIGLTSYTDSLDIIEARLGAFRNQGGISIETADFRGFQDTMKRYTDLCNTIFVGHRFCFHREYAEDLELFSGMKLLLSPYNLLFACREGEDIGFLLMYPDFNELVSAGKGAGVGTYLRHKILSLPFRTIKVVQIAVLPEFQTGGAAVRLFSEAVRRVRRHYPTVERVVSSWILDENQKSSNMVSRIATQGYKRYIAYEKEI
jgi:GNAT superfamily N-acetyltransferase